MHTSKDGNSQEENNDDTMGQGIVTDEVSSIYPLETNDCYFHYSPKTSGQN